MANNDTSTQNHWKTAKTFAKQFQWWKFYNFEFNAWAKRL